MYDLVHCYIHVFLDNRGKDENDMGGKNNFIYARTHTHTHELVIIQRASTISFTKIDSRLHKSDESNKAMSAIANECIRVSPDEVKN